MVREYWGRPDATHVSDCGAIEDEYTAKGCEWLRGASTACEVFDSALRVKRGSVYE